MRRSIILGLALTLAAAPLAQAQTVYVVRHAEKADGGSDPDLSEAGRARAAALAQALAGAGVTHVVTTTLRRTMQTGAPAADAASVTPVAISVEGGAEHIARVADHVRGLPDDAVVLVVGHSNTAPEIARALGDGTPQPIEDCAYDRLTILELSDDAVESVVHARYGAPSAC